MKNNTSNIFLVALMLSGFLVPQFLQAASATWNGGAATSVMNTAANWAGGIAPTASGDTATFDGTQAGDLSLTWTAGFGSASNGTSLNITASQTSKLLIGSSSLLTGATGDFFATGHVTIASGAGAVTLGDGSMEIDNFVFRNPGGTGANTLTNDSANPAVFATNVRFSSGGGAGRPITFAGAGDWQVNASLLPGGAGVFNIVKSGTGTLSLSNTGGVAGATYTISQGVLKVVGAGLLGNSNITGTVANNATLSYESSNTQTLSGVVSGSGVISQSAGTLILSGANTYSGATSILGGTLQVSGTGAINSSSGIAVNGATAKYLHTSSTASTRSISLTQGTVAGTGVIGDVVVANGAGNIANGNANSAVLTAGNITFQGAASISLSDDGNPVTTALVVTGTTLTNPANGIVAVNASNAFWNTGTTYDLVNLGAFTGSVTDFVKGTITGITSRQSANLVLNGSLLGLQVQGDTPKWAGLDSGNWVVGTTGASGNWKLITAGTQTDYLNGDVVLFDDSASNTTVTISAANISPAVTNFDNSSKNYSLGGSFGIATGLLNKNGTGNLTISAANSYAGGTNITAGKIIMSGSGTLGAATGALSIADASLDLGSTTQTVGTIGITGDAVISNGFLIGSSLIASPEGAAEISADLDLGAGGITKSSEGSLTLSGATTYTGVSTINGGALLLDGAADISGSSGITLNGGALDLGGLTQNSNAITFSAASAMGDTLSNGTITPTSLNVTAASGTVIVSANLVGAGAINVSGGNAILSLIGENTISGPLTYTSPGTVRIDGGTNSGGGAIAYNSFGTTFSMTAGTYLTSGISSNNLSEFRALNLFGGVLTCGGDIFSDKNGISITFNGGTLVSNNAAGIGLYDYDNLVNISASGATFDTTVGPITVANNTEMFTTGNVRIPTVNRPSLRGTASGPVLLKGGSTLHAGVVNNGVFTIENASTLNINGIVSSLGGLDGDGTVTNSGAVTTLTIANFSTNTYSGVITGGSNLSLIKNGAGTQNLTGTNTYTGDTFVNDGVLGLGGTAIADTGKLVINAGKVEATGIEVVDKLYFGTVQQVKGTWGATGSGAANIDDVRFSGIAGVVSVTTGPLTGYAAWAQTYANDQPANLDHDGDGVANGVEFFMGATGSTFTANPGVVAGAISWPKSAAFAGSYKVESSDNLQSWVDVTAGAVDNGTSVSYTLPTGQVSKFVRIVVTP